MTDCSILGSSSLSDKTLGHGAVMMFMQINEYDVN